MKEVKMGLDVSEGKLPIYNEPLKEYKDDIVPEFRPVVVHRLEWFVRARIELERRMLVCGVDPRPESLEFTEAHAAVLLVMLQESDSPTAARLRAQAAAWTGGYQLKEAAPILREIVLDENDDLQTRMNAIPAYVDMVGDEAYDVIDTVLASPIVAIRVAAYRVALADRRRKIAELALARLETETSRQVRAEVLRHAALLQERNTTNETEHPLI
jgi:hypothetical protein